MNRSEIIIELGGHTDNVGADDANMKLSQERVNSVKKYLEGKGVKENRIVALGYGEGQPIASNDNEDGRKLNRRVEVKITEIKPREGSGGYEKTEVKNRSDVGINENATKAATSLTLSELPKTLLRRSTKTLTTFLKIKNNSSKSKTILKLTRPKKKIEC